MNPSNYRGVHLTCQLSKIIERVLGYFCTGFFEASFAYGPNQFAYHRHRGYRDALVFNVCSWFKAFHDNKKVALYCSDVSGAFDRVCNVRLIEKLKCSGLHPVLIQFLTSWVQARIAYVIVHGQKSNPIILMDMVFQGTVLGPILWNVFYADARRPVVKKHFTETIFADDLNCFKNYARSIGEDYIFKEMKLCQTEVHRWGKANRVQFDPAKEHFFVLDARGHGNGHFEILGALFDTKLSMFKEICKLASETSKKMRSLLRVKKFYSIPALMRLYKAHVLPYAERSTPAIFHSHPNCLLMLDRIQNDFFEELQVSQRDALLNFNLAPLSVRRSMSMLVVLHRTQLGIAPPMLNAFFLMRRARCIIIVLVLVHAIIGRLRVMLVQRVQCISVGPYSV